MATQYHDKYPLAEQLEEMKDNHAAATMLLNKEPENAQVAEVKPKKLIALLVGCVVALYLVCMLLATMLVKDHYEYRYSQNLDAVREYLNNNVDDLAEMDSVQGYVNSIYDLVATEEEYENISAAFYNEDGKLLATTGSFLLLTIDEKETMYLPLDEYFEIQDILRLREYVRVYQTKYVNEALVDKETKTLISFRIDSAPDFGDSITVWEWKNPKADSYEQEALITVYNKTEVRDIVDIPYCQDEEAYQRWHKDKFLQEFEKTVDVNAKYPARTSKSEFAKSQTEIIEKISYQDEDGKTESYYVVTRATGHQLQAAMDLLFVAYVIAFVVMLAGVLIIVGCGNKLRMCKR